MRRVRLIRGFTLLEMLTALAIIALMIGLLIPAIGKIQTMAQTVKQKAQFHAIEVALEAFRSDVGDYPQSNYTKLDGSSGTNDNYSYTGAQKLAEAMVGLDGLGFHPSSVFRSDGLDGLSIPLYYGAAGFDSLSQPAKDDNLRSRKGPYLELEKANAVKVSSVYVTNEYVNLNTYILADMFQMVKNRATGKRTGMPILYFRADTSKSKLDSGSGGPSDSVYNLDHNLYGFIYVNPPWNTLLSHPLSPLVTTNPHQLFYQRIKNPNFPGTAANNYTDARPYRADSFILLSAGPDGLYGTSDDVYNFDESEK